MSNRLVRWHRSTALVLVPGLQPRRQPAPNVLRIGLGLPHWAQTWACPSGVVLDLPSQASDWA